jgi:hypothetical protein
MRTKTLLVAAAALAAGVITSQAQVYSQNIVGYVNTTLPASVYTLIDNPVDAGTNNAESVLTALQSSDTILFWTGSTYASYQYIAPGLWVYPDGSTGVAPNVPVGTGFFYLNGQGGPETNTFVGSVVLTNTVSFPASIYTLVGSTPPIGVSSLEDTNLNLPLQSSDTVLFWTGSTYASYQFIAPGLWVYPDGTTGVAPGLNVGQGFFYLNGQGSAETWTNDVTVQ